MAPLEKKNAVTVGKHQNERTEMKKQKIDAHSWRMGQITQRINEYNERRREHVMSGQAQANPEWFAKWEAQELEKRKQFESEIQNVQPPALMETR